MLQSCHIPHIQMIQLFVSMLINVYHYVHPIRRPQSLSSHITYIIEIQGAKLLRVSQPNDSFKTKECCNLQNRMSYSNMHRAQGHKKQKRMNGPKKSQGLPQFLDVFWSGLVGCLQSACLICGNSFISFSKNAYIKWFKVPYNPLSLLLKHFPTPSTPNGKHGDQFLLSEDSIRMYQGSPNIPMKNPDNI